MVKAIYSSIFITAISFQFLYAQHNPSIHHINDRIKTHTTLEQSKSVSHEHNEIILTNTGNFSSDYLPWNTHSDTAKSAVVKQNYSFLFVMDDPHNNESKWSILPNKEVNKERVTHLHIPESNVSLSPTEKMGFDETRARNISIKAVRDFVTTFKNVNNNKWYINDTNDGFTSTFEADGIKSTVSYDSEGNRRYIIRTYQEDKMSFEIRDMVKREYYDANITLVKEYETNRGLTIYVHMEDKDSWKIVRIVDGEMQLEQKLDKR